MKRTTISLLVAGLFVAAPGALAQMQVSGSVSGTVLSTDIKTEKNPFRFEEYRDLDSGVSLGADIRGETDTYFLRFFGENIGRDDQFMELSGGKYGAFKYSLYNNDIIHNLTRNAISPFSGIGSKTLTFTAPLSTNPATWTTFDYKIKHENYGGTFELQPSASSPFYFRATANQKETKGIKPIGTPGTSPGGPNYELPAFVNYTTTDASAEVGYATRATQYSLNVSWSKFESHDDTITWRNPAIGTPAAATAIGPAPQTLANIENITLAADNNLWKVAGNAMWKQLPMGSTLALRGTYSKLTNSVPVALAAVAVATVAGSPTGQIVNTNPSSTNFNGEVINKSVSASLTSQWSRALDSRIYYNWSEKDNHSTAIVYTPINRVTGLPAQTCDLNPVTGAGLTTCSTELFHYKKDNAGVDLQYRINPQNRVSGGWDYLDTTRERLDFERTKDNKVYLEWKNGSLDWLTAKVKYQHLDRKADFGFSNLNPALSNNNFFNFYLKRFDLAGNKQDLLKVVLDANPQPFLDLGAELILKDNKYKDVTLGRSKDTREEVYFTAAYGDPKKFRVSAFFDFEATRYDSTHWVGAPNAATFPAPISATRYLWNGKVKDKNYVLGIGADWPYSERLKFRGSLIWQDTDGSVDLASNTALAPLQNVSNYDTFRKTTLDLRGTYSFNKNFDLTLGFAYERFRYTDIQMDGYRYTLGGPAVTSTAIFSGAYAFPDYNATIVYATLKYNIR